MVVFAELGKALRFLRERKGVSQKKVAAAAGITPPMLSSYENGRSKPELETLDKILHRGLDSTLGELAWALDVVNERGRSATGPPQASRSSPAKSLATDDPLPEGPLGEALEEGYRDILRGLFRISRLVVESVAQSPPSRDR